MPMFSMMTLDLSHLEGFPIVVILKKVILCEFSKYNFSLNSIHVTKKGWNQDQTYYLNYISLNLTALVISQW